MPLIIDADGPVQGTLAMPPTWAQLMAAVPNLIGAWTSEGMAAGAIPSWPASHGSGLLTQATVGAQPTAVSAGGKMVASFGVGKRLDLSGALTSGTPMTIAMRVNLLALNDNQALFGGSSTYRCRWRTTSGGLFNMDTAGTDVNCPATTTGWYDVVLVQDASSYTMQVGSGTVMAGTSPGATITSLAIGALAGNDVTSNWHGYMSRIAIARARPRIPSRAMSHPMHATVTRVFAEMSPNAKLPSRDRDRRD